MLINGTFDDPHYPANAVVISTAGTFVLDIEYPDSLASTWLLVICMFYSIIEPLFRFLLTWVPLDDEIDTGVATFWFIMFEHDVYVGKRIVSTVQTQQHRLIIDLVCVGQKAFQKIRRAFLTVLFTFPELAVTLAPTLSRKLTHALSTNGRNSTARESIR